MGHYYFFIHFLSDRPIVRSCLKMEIPRAVNRELIFLPNPPDITIIHPCSDLLLVDYSFKKKIFFSYPCLLQKKNKTIEWKLRDGESPSLFPRKDSLDWISPLALTIHMGKWACASCLIKWRKNF